MSHSYRTIQYQDRRNLSFSSVAVILIFFLVTSQIFILPLPETVTQLFRPLLIVMFIIHMQKCGSIQLPLRVIALLVGVHALAVLLLNSGLWNEKNISNGVAVALYFFMLSFAIGVNWTKRELKWILFACFFGSFVCAAALLASNDPTNFNAASAGNLNLVGFSVNRNKNAYQYAFGCIIGLIYLLKGKKNKKLLIFMFEAVTGYALLYSQCRGAFFSFVFGATILFIGLLLEMGKNNSGKAFAYAVLMVISYIAIYYLLKNSDLSRLVDSESTSGRDEGIQAAWKLFLNSDWFCKLFGNGFGFEHQQTQEIGAHMVYVSFLVSMGLIGSGLTIGVFYSALKSNFGAGSYALLAVSFLKTFFEVADYNNFIPLILSVVICNYTRVTGRKYYELFGKTRKPAA